jgi:HAD superfamily hydrolase (TIGR01549 family)
MARAVLFDIDGTLIDSVDLHAEAWRQAFARFGKELPFQQVRSQIGKGGDQLMPVFLSPEELGRFGEALEAYRGDLYKRQFLPRVRPFPAVRPLFQRIRADGKPIALASSAKGDELETYIRLTEVGDLITAATSADDAERSKPEPDIFQAALGRLRLPPDGVVVVGDTPYDAQAARRAGLAPLGVLCGGFPEADLRAAGCREIYRDPADLLARYDQTAIHNSGMPT